MKNFKISRGVKNFHSKTFIGGIRLISSLILTVFFVAGSGVMASGQSFQALAFFTAKNDKGHISFVKEANRWMAEMAKTHGFRYDTTSNWKNLNTENLQRYQLILFLDTRPEGPDERMAFKQYMNRGGGWIGFHFAAFALTPSAYPQNWDWYHSTFLGSGQYKSNTWRPTAAYLKLEHPANPHAKGLPTVIRSSPNEWYRWTNDLRRNPDIEVLASIDKSSFPLGSGPKPNEIWYSGDYPVVWTNKRYDMVYFNMGHNDIDYENGTNKELSHTFGNPMQDKLILNAILWVAARSKIR